MMEHSGYKRNNSLMQIYVIYTYILYIHLIYTIHYTHVLFLYFFLYGFYVLRHFSKAAIINRVKMSVIIG